MDRPRRFEYRLTEKGLDLYAVVVSLAAGGIGTCWPEGAARPERVHAAAGSGDAHVHLRHCGEPVTARDMQARPGPAYRMENGR